MSDLAPADAAATPPPSPEPEGLVDRAGDRPATSSSEAVASRWEAAPFDTAPAPFAKVPEPLRNALIARGFTQLTAVQQAVLAADDGHGDLRISSQTGSGKTVAIGFALAQRLRERAPGAVGPSTLVLVPTRELAAQVKDELSWLFGALPARLETVTGGTSIERERRNLARRPNVLVATPGRLNDHLRNGAVDLSAVQQVVLDEADQMLDLGFRDDLEAILSTMPAQRRTHLVSATFPPEVRALTQRFQRNAVLIEGTAPGEAHADIEHVAHLIHGRDRYAALVNLLLMAGDERTLVFVRTRMDTAELADKLIADGFAAAPISGELAQSQRTRTLDAFRRGSVTTLIATDVAARGLDIQNVTMVVHGDPPIDPETYTHRSGRTGRAGQKGKSISLVPKLREGAIRRLLSRSGAEVRWQPVPGAAQVRQVQQERQAARVRESLAEAAAPSPIQLALADELLAANEPRELVARLLGAFAKEPTRAPFDIASAPAAKERRPRHEEWSRGDERPRHEAPNAGVRLRAEFAPTAEAPQRAQNGPARFDADRKRSYVAFTINWGFAEGADVKRLLAHICRRGDVSSKMVGVIDLERDHSQFEIDAAVADEFGARVAQRDPRDPHLVIAPAGTAMTRSAPSAPRPKPRFARAPAPHWKTRRPRY